MKTLFRTFFCLCIVFAFSCKGNNKTSFGEGVVAERTSDGIPIVNVQGAYPTNEIILQDIADVDYIPLETRDDILVSGNIAYYSKKHLVLYNPTQGDVFVFDSKTGKALSKFNRKGNGNNEYLSISGLAYDEDLGELYIADNRTMSTILVYSREGSFIKTLSLPEDLRIERIQNADKENLFIYNQYRSTQEGINQSQPYLFVSKKDGQVASRMDLKFAKRLGNRVAIPLSAGAILPITIYLPRNIKYGDEYILSDLSCDTVFQYTQKHGLKPLLIKTPSVWNSKDAFLGMTSSLKTDRLIHISAVVYDYDAIRKGYEQGNIPPLKTIDLMYDLQENAVFISKIMNTDSASEYRFYDNDSVDSQEKNTHTSFLAAEKLVDALEKGELSGKLKTIAESLLEDDNPVLMVARFK
jgi:hypothetical protein